MIQDEQAVLLILDVVWRDFQHATLVKSLEDTSITETFMFVSLTTPQNDDHVVNNLMHTLRCITPIIALILITFISWVRYHTFFTSRCNSSTVI